MTRRIGEWDGDIAAARARQDELAKNLVLRDQFARPLRTIAGFAVGFEDDVAITRAAAVLLDADTLEVLDQQVARLPTTMPRIPGMLSFRELPALLAALAMLKHPPDLAFLGGQGIAHPRRLGIAAHFGVHTGLPSIGVATDILIGTSITNLHDMRGAFTPLRDGREQIGWLLRSKPGCLPLVVSPGHRVALASAPELVMRYVGRYRLPEPTRLADRLVHHSGLPPASAPL
ncbi:MAG: deoxyribonuclease V [Pseudomonadota bacterium]